MIKKCLQSADPTVILFEKLSKLINDSWQLIKSKSKQDKKQKFKEKMELWKKLIFWLAGVYYTFTSEFSFSRDILQAFCWSFGLISKIWRNYLRDKVDWKNYEIWSEDCLIRLGQELILWDEIYLTVRDGRLFFRFRSKLCKKLRENVLR